MMGDMVAIQRGVVDIGHHETKLHATAPVVGYLARVVETMLQVYRGLINVVAEGEEEDAPR